MTYTPEQRAHRNERLFNAGFITVAQAMNNAKLTQEQLGVSEPLKQDFINACDAAMAALNAVCAAGGACMVSVGVQPLSGGNKGDPD